MYIYIYIYIVRNRTYMYVYIYNVRYRTLSSRCTEENGLCMYIHITYGKVPRYHRFVPKKTERALSLCVHPLASARCTLRPHTLVA